MMMTASGNPKGVVLPHRAFGIAVAAGTRDIEPSDKDVHCSYLPLAHIFEAVVQAFISACGAKCGYFQANIKVIGQDWKDLRPTILVGVPRVFTKTYDKFKLKVGGMGSFKKWMVNNASNSSTKEIRQGSSHSISLSISLSKYFYGEFLVSKHGESAFCVETLVYFEIHTIVEQENVIISLQNHVAHHFMN